MNTKSICIRGLFALVCIGAPWFMNLDHATIAISETSMAVIGYITLAVVEWFHGETRKSFDAMYENNKSLIALNRELIDCNRKLIGE